MIYFKLFYDILYNKDAIQSKFDNLKIKCTMDKKNNIIIIRFNKKSKFYKKDKNYCFA